MIFVVILAVDLLGIEKFPTGQRLDIRIDARGFSPVGHRLIHRVKGRMVPLDFDRKPELSRFSRHHCRRGRFRLTEIVVYIGRP